MDRLAVLRRIAPEIVELVQTRHAILRNVSFGEPIGRRVLASQLGMRERAIRREVDVLRQQGLLTSEPMGMRLTPLGRAVLASLAEFIRELSGIDELETSLSRMLGLKRVIVVPGNSDEDETVKKEIARATGEFLSEVIEPGQILAVTGGTTLSEVARSLSLSTSNRDVTVVPARGGLGEDVELQANTVAANLARHLGARCRLLHIPDDLGEEAYSTLSNEPKIREVLELIKNADIVLHGIGTAGEMARRRGMPPRQVAILRENQAVGEAFGYYFDHRGRIVYTTNSVGLRLEDLHRTKLVIAVGGGTSKADAALAVLSNHYQDVLITDEGMAHCMLKKLSEDRDEQGSTSAQADLMEDLLGQ